MSLPSADRQRTRRVEKHLQILEAGPSRNGSSVPDRGRRHFPSTTFMSAVCSPQPDQRVSMPVSPDISRPGCDLDDSPLYGVDFKNVVSCTSIPPYVLVSWWKG